MSCVNTVAGLNSRLMKSQIKCPLLDQYCANATTHHLLGASGPAQTIPVSTQHQQVQTSINLNQYQAGFLFLNLKMSNLKSRLFEWLFKKNGFLAVSGSDLGFELTVRATSSLRQKSSRPCFSATCSLPCINPQALT